MQTLNPSYLTRVLINTDYHWTHVSKYCSQISSWIFASAFSIGTIWNSRCLVLKYHQHNDKFWQNFDDTIQWHWQQKENWLIQSKKAWGQNKGKDRSHKTAQVPGGRYLQCPAKSLQIFIFKGDHSSASGVTKNLKAVTKIYFHDRNCKLGCQFSILLNGTPKSTLRQHKLNIERAR